MAADEFSADLAALTRTSSGIQTLAGNSGSTASELGGLVVDVLSFAQIGSEVGAANTSLQSTLQQALNKVSTLLGDIGKLVGTSAQGYAADDDTIARALGGSTSDTSATTPQTNDGITRSAADDPLRAQIAAVHPVPGQRGDDVQKLQQMLTDAGYDTKGADGKWGTNSQTALNAYLKSAAPAGDTYAHVDPAPVDPPPPSRPAEDGGHVRVKGKLVPTYDMTGQTAPTTAPAGDLDQWVTQAKSVLAANGVDTSSMKDSDLRALIQHESGSKWNEINNWDVNARNGVPSKGLMQVIPTTFDTWSVAGHRDIWNPVDNIVAGVRYGIDRYHGFDNIPGVKSLNSGGGYKPY